MLLYGLTLLLGLLALRVQWKDGVRGFGTTNGTQSLVRGLWVFAVVLLGIGVGRDLGVPLGLVTTIVGYLAADRLVARLDRLAIRFGPRDAPAASAPPLGPLAEAERALRDRSRNTG